MSEKWKKRLMGIFLLLAGAALVYFGIFGAFGLFEKKPAAGWYGDEVPRDMIETGYLNKPSEGIPTEEQAEGNSFVYAPVEVTPGQALPTLAAADPTEVNLAANPSPDAPPIEEPTQDLTATLSPTEESEDVIPRWIYIKAIALDAPIIPATSSMVEVEENGKTYRLLQWQAPDEAAVGWHEDSAPLGVVGNTVLTGHHNVHGKVFGLLAYLQEGDIIQVYGSDEQWYTYAVAKKMVLPEVGVSLEKRMQNAAWILPSTDERLTLITCWPEQTNTHRLIIVAQPVREEGE